MASTALDSILMRIQAALQAADVALKPFLTGAVASSQKSSGRGPVTEADRVVDRVLREELLRDGEAGFRRKAPTISVVSRSLTFGLLTRSTALGNSSTASLSGAFLSDGSRKAAPLRAASIIQLLARCSSVCLIGRTIQRTIGPC